jgi:hypothetical protein
MHAQMHRNWMNMLYPLHNWALQYSNIVMYYTAIFISIYIITNPLNEKFFLLHANLY